VDILEILRRQAGRFQCPNCGKSMADCELELLSRGDNESLVKVACRHCEDTRVIAVQVAAEVTPANPAAALDQAPTEAPVLTADDVLDARLALRSFEGDLKSLLKA
jgi:hypothetical protein